jgi:N-acetylneuraminic acid mutarotase
MVFSGCTINVSWETMKKLFAFLLLLVFIGSMSAATETGVDPLPDPVSNNAVALLRVHWQVLLFSFMGIGSKKTPDAITSTAFSLDATEGKWSAIHPVPGTAGRIGAMAAPVHDQIFLLGGYIVDAHGDEMAVPDVGAYQPSHDRWFRGTDLPVPVSDSVVGVHRDRYVYVIGGHSNSGVANNVQVSGNAPRYVASDQCWMGKIDRHDPDKIQWSKLPNHPGAARYRIAAGASEKDERIYFSGGTDNPYDYNGIGFDGKPSEPSPVTFDFNLHTGKWETINDNTPDPTMDHRGLLVTHEGLVLIGGMEKGQKVTARVTLLSKEPKAK